MAAHFVRLSENVKRAPQGQLLSSCKANKRAAGGRGGSARRNRSLCVVKAAETAACTCTAKGRFELAVRVAVGAAFGAEVDGRAPLKLGLVALLFLGHVPGAETLARRLDLRGRAQREAQP